MFPGRPAGISASAGYGGGRLEDDLGNLIASATGVGCIESDVAGWLPNFTHYRWRVRATDPAGKSSEFSAPSRFQIDAPIEIDCAVVVVDGGCRSSRAPGPGALVAVGLGLAGLVRRRR